MKKLLILLIIGLLLTGCSGTSYDYDGQYEDYDGAKEYFADVATEAMTDVYYDDDYCQNINAPSVSECLETFRDELIEQVYDKITD